MNQEINFNLNQQPEDGFSLNQLWDQTREWLRPPVFADDLEKTRVARSLNTILLALVFGMLALAVSTFFFRAGGNPILILGSIIVIAVLVTGLIAIRRGIVRRTAIVFVSAFFLASLTFIGLFGKAYDNPVFPVLFLVVFLAGFLISNRAAIIFGLLSWVMVQGFYMIGNVMDLPVMIEKSEGIFFVTFSTALILFAFFVVSTSRSYSNAFDQIDETEAALQGSNRELQDIRVYLEEEVEKNTRQLERRARYLEAGAKVGQVSILTNDLQEMLDRVAAEISSLFGFYHVGIFLLDGGKEWAVMRAASSDGGQLMLARNHRLGVGRQGIVGFVTSLGQGRISQDVGDDRIHTPAPELPQTRSEMALPLKVRNQIIGALDIQDTKPEAFTEEDITVLQTMADQIALAVENIRLFTQSQETLDEIQQVYGEYSERSWREAQQKNRFASYRYFGGTVTEAGQKSQAEASEDSVSIPVEVRGAPLGAIEISKGEDESNWSSEELALLHAVAEQLGIALDSARLFNESQLRASTEHAISQINSQLWESMDLTSILKTTAENLRETLALPELTIRMAAPDSEPSPNGNPTAEEAIEND